MPCLLRFMTYDLFYNRQEMAEKAKEVVERLQAHHFKAIYLRTKEEAAHEILKHVVQSQKINDRRAGHSGQGGIRILKIEEFRN
jgi:hypothetical protein